MNAYSIAKAANMPTYHGNPCKRCGSTIRMTSTCSCQGCEAIRKMNKATAEEIKQEAIYNRENASALKPWQIKMRNVRYNGENEYPNIPPYNYTDKPPLICRTNINNWQA